MNDEATSFALLDAYHTCGGNFVQTLGYCSNSTVADAIDPRSEDIVGRWRQVRGIDRGTLNLATRMNFFRPAHGGSIAFANLIREACERSLRRLKTTHLDLLICEWDEQLVPVDDIIEAIDMLIRAGLVRYAVAGGFPPWRVVDSLHRASVRHLARFEALQTEYSLMTRTRFEREALSLCREHRLGFLARSPLAGGFLAQRTSSLPEFAGAERSWVNERFGNRSADLVLAALGEIADKRLASPAQVALAWVLRNPQVTSAVISPLNVESLRELARATQLGLGDPEVGALANVTTVQDFRMELRHV